MKEQFVTREISEILKSKGFDEKCLAFYDEDNIFFPFTNLNFDENAGYASGNYFPFANVKSKTEEIAAPLWQQVIDWLRDKHSIYAEVEKTNFKNDDFLVKVRRYNKNDRLCKASKYDSFRTHSKAREQAIIKSLKLI